MRKKVLAALVGISMIATLAGCGSKISTDNITISKYKNVEIEKQEVAKVSDEDVESSIQMTLSENAQETPITDRPVQEGDIATIDFEGKKDGVAFEGGSATDTPLEIGSGSFIEGFEEGVVGHSTGETFDIPLTFPENYQSEELKGQAVVFTVTIKSITQRVVPELTDDFVKDLSEKAKTVEEYKKQVKKDLETSNVESADGKIAELAMAEVLKNTKVEKYPEDRVKDITEKLTAQYEQMAAYYGVEFSVFIQEQFQMTQEQFEKESKKVAKDNVKKTLIVEAIAKQENLIPTDKEYEKEYEKLAKQYGYENLEDFTAQTNASKEDMNAVILQDIVSEWFVKNSKQVEPKKDEADTEVKDGTAEDKNEVTPEE